jgi:hypothetical protein
MRSNQELEPYDPYYDSGDSEKLPERDQGYGVILLTARIRDSSPYAHSLADMAANTEFRYFPAP